MANIQTELITTALSFIFTIMILSYLIGDNPLFRIAIYIFVGVSAGYSASVAWHHVLWPKLLQPFIFNNGTDRLLLMVPLLLGILLIMKLSPRTTQFGNPPMAFLVGTGAAVAIGGAIFGTLIPQSLASINLLDLNTGSSRVQTLAEGVIMLLGTVTTLVFFHFGAKIKPGGPRRNLFIDILAWIGQVFIAITFGVLFAGVLTAALTALIERMAFITTFLVNLF
jgi:hypothetical protein